MPDSDKRLLRLVTWNVARRTSVIVEQATALAVREPDIAALQEVTPRTIPLWRQAFAAIGLSHARASLDEAPTARRAGSPRMGVMLASREPLHDVAHAPQMPRAESALCAVTDSPAGEVEVWSVHVPNAANGWVKPNSLRALRDALTVATPRPRVVCGDLNTPRRELPGGEVMSFARDSRGRLRPERGPEWDAAELGVVPGLNDLGYADAFRSLHGYGAREPSWTWRQTAGHGGGWRLDHVFVSAELRPVSCTYHHDWRERGLSDHSALEAELVLRL
jgi:endonuclease/exonuclease/phosphatase family metal-dependent hydrolase